jgi:hypothetical protein
MTIPTKWNVDTTRPNDGRDAYGHMVPHQYGKFVEYREYKQLREDLEKAIGLLVQTNHLVSNERENGCQSISPATHKEHEAYWSGVEAEIDELCSKYDK